MVTRTSAACVVLTLLLIATVFSNVSSCFTSERNALLDFKHSLNDYSNRLSSWVGDECCNWVGIRCSRQTGHVSEVDLRNPFDYYDDSWERYSLGGELNNSLQVLKHLTYLDLSMNKFSGIYIPDFLGSLINLRYLNLSSSSFNGKVPHHLGNLSRLQYLDLSNNALQNIHSLWWASKLYSLKHLDLSWVDLSNTTNWFQSIKMLSSLSVLNLCGCKLDFVNVPAHSNINFTFLLSLDLSSDHLKANGNIVFDWLYNITGLVKLSLSDNNYGGPIPESIVRFSSLSFLDLSYNKLVGSIPSEISSLHQLRYLDLRYNKLTGNLPSSFQKLPGKEQFDIRSNRLSSTVPPFIGQLSNLETLNIGKNDMSGIISDNYFQHLTSLKYLDLSSNSDLVMNFSSTWTPPFQLTSLELSSVKVGPTFPRWLQNQRNLNHLHLSNASIADNIPRWFSSLNFQILDLSENKLTGNLLLVHSSFQILYVRNNLLSGLTVSNASNSLKWLDASNNLLIGAFPTWLCNMKSVEIIDLSNNQLSGILPSCIGSLQRLRRLDLTNNTFSGSIQSSLGSLPLLQSLHLRNNNFRGHIPSSFQKLTGLYTLDLGENSITGIIPPWIGENLSTLIVLSLGFNSLHGPIPQQLCQLFYLQTLNLVENNISGSIPSCLHNLTAMSRSQYLTRYYYGDKILEHLEAAERLYNAEYFISMDLSNNNIVGVIPTELMDLYGLVKLNLSGNHIEGRIPDKIGNLIQLQSLDLSRNKLSGPIPQSLSNLSFLSHLNMSFNNLSGQIPTGRQLQTLNDPSIYMGNGPLCGLPLKQCKGEDGSSDHSHENKHDEEEDDINVEIWFYSGMGPGLLVGFLGFCGALHFNKRWRYAYFNFFENVYDTVAVAIPVWAAWLHRKFKTYRSVRMNSSNDS